MQYWRGRSLIWYTKSRTCLEGLVKVTKNLCEESRPPGRCLNLAPSECEIGGLTETPRRWLTGSAMAVVEHEEFDTHTHTHEDQKIWECTKTKFWQDYYSPEAANLCIILKPELWQGFRSVSVTVSRYHAFTVLHERIGFSLNSILSQNYWVFELFLSSWILESSKTQ